MSNPTMPADTPQLFVHRLEVAFKPLDKRVESIESNLDHIKAAVKVLEADVKVLLADMARRGPRKDQDAVEWRW